MTPRRLHLAALIAISCLTIAACGGDDDEPTDDAPTTAASGNTEPAPLDETTTGDSNAAGQVKVEGFTFILPPTVGTSFEIVNADPAAHTLTDNGGAFDIEVPANATTEADIPAGTYQVRCKIHANMTGTLGVA